MENISDKKPRYAWLIYRNAISNIFRYVVIMTTMIITVPFILKRIGVELYGVWSLILVFSNLPSMLELGVGTALIKFVPDMKERGSAEDVNQVINFGILFYAFLGFIVILILFIMRDWIVINVFKPTQLNLKEVKSVFLVSLLVTWFSFTLAPYITSFIGFQRFDLYAMVGILECIGRSVLIIIFLSMGLGLKGLILANIGGLIITLLIGFYSMAKVFPEFKLMLNMDCIKSIGKQMLCYGIKTVIPGLVIWQQLDKIFLGYFLTANYVSYYQLGNGMAKQFRNIPDYIIYPIFPTACALNAVDDTKRIKELYFQAQKYNFLILLPLFTFGFVFAPILIKLWLGKGFDLVILTFRVFLITLFIFQTSAVPLIMLNSIGYPQEGMKASILSLIIILLFCPLLVWKFGYNGALVAVSLSIIVFSLWVKFIFHYKTKISFRDLIVKFFQIPTLAAGIPGIMILCLNYKYSFNLFEQGIFVGGFIFVYVAIILLSKYYNEADFKHLINIIKQN